MSSLVEVKVPDVGNVPEIDIVEVLVQPGDVVAIEQTLAVMETDKATMDLPSSAAGIVKSVHIKPGDKVAEGTLIVTVEVGEAAAAPAAQAAAPAAPAPVEPEPAAPAPVAEPPKAESAKMVEAAATASVAASGEASNLTPLPVSACSLASSASI